MLFALSSSSLCKTSPNTDFKSKIWAKSKEKYTVLDWFKQIKNKHLYKFATFDIKEFYPSIKECLLKML